MKTSSHSAKQTMKYHTGSPLISQLSGASHLTGKESK